MAHFGPVTSNPNYSYFPHWARSVGLPPEAKILDFGCGNAITVGLLRSTGFQAYGSDVFYQGGSRYAADVQAQIDLLMEQGIVRLVEPDGRQPFADEYFDAVVANMVFEHLSDPASALAEIARVLRPGGLAILHFPSLETWREGHNSIPFIHWIDRSHPARRAYMLGMRLLGFGAHKRGQSVGEWVDHQLEWLDSYCFYRPIQVVEAMAAAWFDVAHDEIRYIQFRANPRPILRTLSRIETMRAPLEWFFRRVAFSALLLRRR